MGPQHWWKTGAAPNDYEFGLAEDTFEGGRVAYLRSIVQPARSFGALCQTIAEDYRGKRIRFSAALKANNVTGGWGGLWPRVDGVHLDETLAIDTMEDRPLWARPAGNSTPWCWMSPRRRRRRSTSVLGCLGRGSCWCRSWPSRRSTATYRSPPAPSSTAAAEPLTSARPDSSVYPPGQATLRPMAAAAPGEQVRLEDLAQVG
jgi:hypothetical protein